MAARQLNTEYDFQNTDKPLSARIRVFETAEEKDTITLYDEPAPLGQIARLERALGARYRVPNDARAYSFRADGRLQSAKFSRCNRCADFSSCLEEGACRPKR